MVYKCGWQNIKKHGWIDDDKATMAKNGYILAK